MPLPDERPRASVANLIGRFEQQNKFKGTTSTPPLIPRSSSGLSQHTGDAAKEELRGKREWPPKSVVSAEKPALTPSSSSISITKEPVASPQPTVPTPSESLVMQPPTESTSPPPPPPPEVTKNLEGRKPAAKAPAVVAVRKSVSPTKAPPGKSTHSATKVTPKSPPRTAQPLRPQNTGHASTSHASAAGSVPRSATPKNPGTPKHARPLGSMSPSTGASRPKTPSSGLYAPTAASLARSRNAPHAPAPIKKVASGSSSADRLSKPTAASLSKTRSAAPMGSVGTPPRNLKSPTNSPLASAVTKTSLAPIATKPRDPKAKPAAKQTAGAGVAGVSTTAASVAAKQQTPHEDQADELHAGPKQLQEASQDLPDVHKDIREEALKGSREETVFSEGESEVVDEPHEESHPEESEHAEAAGEECHANDEAAHMEEEHHSDMPPVEGHEAEAPGDQGQTTAECEEVTEETKTISSVNGHDMEEKMVIPEVEVEHVENAPAAAHDDIEAMVNLLEGTKLVNNRPRSIASIPDEDN